MFTGIIEDVGTVKSVEQRGGFVRIEIATALPCREIRRGDSISVDGACLTVVAADEKTFAAEASKETVAKTGAGKLRGGSRVNVERSLRLSDRLGGHFVLGHVDGKGRITDRFESGDFLILRVEAPEEAARFLVAKGSVALDGISLTVNKVEGNIFEVGIIGVTREKTTIAAKYEGDEVNVEADIIGKYVRKFIREGRNEGSGITLDFLSNHGFL